MTALSTIGLHGVPFVPYGVIADKAEAVVVDTADTHDGGRAERKYPLNEVLLPPSDEERKPQERKPSARPEERKPEPPERQPVAAQAPPIPPPSVAAMETITALVDARAELAELARRLTFMDITLPGAPVAPMVEIELNRNSDDIDALIALGML